ncbi:MAG: acyl-CoA dehydrogenase [Alphaproteobacteria bacterium]|nr:acyl-CoA dehydrogenase [Alphaproteobacteria bacterium]
MPLMLNEDQVQLKDAARAFIQAKSPVTAFRKLRDNREPDGFDRKLWKEMAELGWAGIIIPEEFGGVGFGYVGLGVVLEEAGRTLLASPLISTALIGATAVLLGGSSAQKKEILPAITTGGWLMALAHEEGPHHSPYAVSTKAKAEGDGFILSGKKTFVLDGHVADQLIVVARTSGKRDAKQGLTLFLVDRATPGVKVTRMHMTDSRNAANVSFSKVKLGRHHVLGGIDQGTDILDAVLDRARIGLAAEMLGGVREEFERTVEYLKTRQQFGVLIGSFQALKHRAAEMFCEIELSVSVVLDGLIAIDENRNDVPQIASLVKARLNDTYFLVSNEALQMHGGIGMTDEFDMGLFMKRARVAMASFGDSLFHRDRYAALEGY